MTQHERNHSELDEDELDIEIRPSTHVDHVFTDVTNQGNHTKGKRGTIWKSNAESTALEMCEDTIENEPQPTATKFIRKILKLPNSAIKHTWSKLDISEEGICEAEQYGECRDGWIYKTIHDLLFGSNTMQGQICGVLILLMISTSVILATLDSVYSIRLEYGETIYTLEAIFTIIFAVEYILRVSCLRKPSEYICSAMGIVDISSIVPTFITFFIPHARPLADLATLRIFRVIRVFRVLRLVRFVDAARALEDNIDANKLRIAVFMFSVFSMIVVIGCTMYLIEGEANGFSNIPVSLYWAVVTLTTVGYGDIAPQTVPGRLLATMVMFSGYGVIACPLVLNTQTEEEKLGMHCECARCFRRLHQEDANFCRHCGAALRATTKPRKKIKEVSKEVVPV
uniref:Voltagegated Ion Channel (VIC) Superfamily putative n=1 Tax=Albugo laibachii Nc14 TaxID=890382 RepID=F0WRI9_9STRA|nr:Voltagegated Ion Channel (VIC) Superfamily putative [Albugo laibachii Nc14]|eukprot:CCA23952.1 Voltagegated Ion Channel (VIC) Superfamily putative [Albugo laibachii Nc14]